MISERLISIDDESAWRDALSADDSVFGSWEFSRNAKKHWTFEPFLYVLDSPRASITYPLWLRPVNSLPFVVNTTTQWDSGTPEYTGPISLGSSHNLNELEFSARFAQLCRERKIVAEFAHLNPWLVDLRLLNPEGLHFDREIVYVDLSWSEDKLWRESFSRACRKNISRSAREDVKVYFGSEERDIREFHRLYSQTMERNHAADRYFHSVDFFMSFLEELSSHACFALAEYREQIVAGTLFLYDNLNVYSYLGGADYVFQHVRPTNAIVYETIRWAQQQGKNRLVLGGGYKPNDGIFRFKSSFSPLRVRFHTYAQIHLRDEFTRLCDAWSDHYGRQIDLNSYFPAYRAEPSQVV